MEIHQFSTANGAGRSTRSRRSLTEAFRPSLRDMVARRTSEFRSERADLMQDVGSLTVSPLFSSLDHNCRTPLGASIGTFVVHELKLHFVFRRTWNTISRHDRMALMDQTFLNFYVVYIHRLRSGIPTHQSSSLLLFPDLNEVLVSSATSTNQTPVHCLYRFSGFPVLLAKSVD